jgi:hypothetical protein
MGSFWHFWNYFESAIYSGRISKVCSGNKKNGSEIVNRCKCKFIPDICALTISL